jgi:hypothetical protein
MSDQPRKRKYGDSSLLTSVSPTEEDAEDTDDADDADDDEIDWETVTD